MTNEELYETALEAINKLFNDMSVSQSEALENLANLKAEIDILADSLKEAQS